MIMLAIDTCFARCAACLFDSASGQVLAQQDVAMERGHAEVLAPMVAGLLEVAHITPTDLARIAVTAGPGTFTGLRIGLSFARALGLALNIPVIGLDTLRAVAMAAPGLQGPVLVLHQAGQSGFFYAWDPGHGGNIALLSRADIAARPIAAGTLVLGTGAAAISGPHVVRRPAWDLPDLALLARFAAAQPAATTMPGPVYVREAHAKPQTGAQIAIRNAVAGDVAALSQLHQASFSPGWTVHDMAAMLATTGTHALVGESDGQISSLLIFRAIAGEAEILTLATAPTRRRLGHGAKILKALIARAGLQMVSEIFLEVAADNQAARALYRQFKFAEVGQRKGYYARPGGKTEDAILMKRAVTP